MLDMFQGHFPSTLSFGELFANCPFFFPQNIYLYRVRDWDRDRDRDRKIDDICDIDIHIDLAPCSSQSLLIDQRGREPLK